MGDKKNALSHHPSPITYHFNKFCLKNWDKDVKIGPLFESRASFSTFERRPLIPTLFDCRHVAQKLIPQLEGFCLNNNYYCVPSLRSNFSETENFIHSACHRAAHRARRGQLWRSLVSWVARGRALHSAEAHRPAPPPRDCGRLALHHHLRLSA